MGAMAASTHGVVTRAQLLGAGISASEIAHRLNTGALRREHRGVYRVGHQAPSTEASYMAAVLAGGEGARLSGRAAGYLLGILRGPPPEPEVTTPTERQVKGVSTRRERSMDSRDATTWRGIRVTTVARTLVDLAAVLSTEELARACHEAGVRHGTSPRRVEAVLAQRPNSAGAANLKAILRGDTPVTLSALE